jgi:hypothetical protein
MALPTTSSTGAGTTTQTSYVPGSQNYTGTYGAVNSNVIYLSDKTDAKTLAASNGSYGSSSAPPSSGPGKRKKPDFSGLDKALGIIGSAVALVEGAKNLYGVWKGAWDAATARANAAVSAARAVTETIEEVGELTVATNDLESDWRVRISTNLASFSGGSEVSGILSPLVSTKGLVFPFVPQVNITHKANYTTTEPIHSNYPFLGYKNSSIEDITISGEFAVNTDEDAVYWIAATTFLKATTKMFYGMSNPQGNPPVVCRLNGYGAHVFDNIPIVVKSYQIELPKDVNYKRVVTVETSGADSWATEDMWVPMMSTITVIVSPVYNRENLRKFSMADYVGGTARGVL